MRKVRGIILAVLTLVASASVAVAQQYCPNGWYPVGRDQCCPLGTMPVMGPWGVMQCK